MSGTLIDCHGARDIRADLQVLIISLLLEHTQGRKCRQAALIQSCTFIPQAYTKISCLDQIHIDAFDNITLALV